MISDILVLAELQPSLFGGFIEERAERKEGNLDRPGHLGTRHPVHCVSRAGCADGSLNAAWEPSGSHAVTLYHHVRKRKRNSCFIFPSERRKEAGNQAYTKRRPPFRAVVVLYSQSDERFLRRTESRRRESEQIFSRKLCGLKKLSSRSDYNARVWRGANEVRSEGADGAGRSACSFAICENF